MWMLLARQPGKAIGVRGTRVRTCAIMIDDDSEPGSGGLREGEVAVELPAQFDASLYYIGRIHTPWKRREECPKNPRESDAFCTIELDPRWVEGLQRPGQRQPRGRALLDGQGAARPRAAGAAPLCRASRHVRAALAGAAQSDRRSVARLIRIDGNVLSVVGLDCLDNTPLLDIKPYFASTNAVPDAAVGWHAGGKRYSRRPLPPLGAEGWGEGGLWLAPNRGHGPHPLRSARDLSRGRERGRVCTMGGAKRYPS